MIDILSETTTTKLLANPAKEIGRLINILFEREGSQHVTGSFKAINKFAFILHLPKIKRAFKEAMMGINLEDLQYDEADRYLVAPLAGYNFFGEKVEERLNKYHDGRAGIPMYAQ